MCLKNSGQILTMLSAEIEYKLIKLHPWWFFAPGFVYGTSSQIYSCLDDTGQNLHVKAFCTPNFANCGNFLLCTSKQTLNHDDVSPSLAAWGHVFVGLCNAKKCKCMAGISGIHFS